MYLEGDDRTYEISENELIEFLQNYANTLGITEEQEKSRRQIQLVSDEDINLVIHKLTKEDLLETGCDFSSVFKEQENIETEILKEENIDKVENQEQMALVEYKESFIKKLVKRVREKYQGIKEKLFNRDKRIQEEIQQNTNMQNLQENELPSWDLKNWTQEELADSKAYASQSLQNNREEKDRKNENNAR